MTVKEEGSVHRQGHEKHLQESVPSSRPMHAKISRPWWPEHVRLQSAG